MTCCKYNVYLYGSETIRYLNAFFLVLTEYYESSDCPHPPLQAALPLSVWQHNLRPFRRELTIPMLKSKGKACMVEEPSHVKQLSLNHVSKIGLSVCYKVPTGVVDTEQGEGARAGGGEAAAGGEPVLLQGEGGADPCPPRLRHPGPGAHPPCGHPTARTAGRATPQGEGKDGGYRTRALLTSATQDQGLT